MPEAQLDRFFFKLVVGYSSREELAGIVDRTTRGITVHPEKVMDGAEILQWQQLIREVILSLNTSRTTSCDWSCRRIPMARMRCRSPISICAGAAVLAALKRWRWRPSVRALLEGRYNVSFEDVRRVYLPAMRHRVILNFEAQAENIDTDHVLLEILEKVPRNATACRWRPRSRIRKCARGPTSLADLRRPTADS